MHIWTSTSWNLKDSKEKGWSVSVEGFPQMIWKIEWRYLSRKWERVQQKVNIKKTIHWPLSYIKYILYFNADSLRCYQCLCSGQSLLMVTNDVTKEMRNATRCHCWFCSFSSSSAVVWLPNIIANTPHYLYHEKHLGTTRKDERSIRIVGRYGSRGRNRRFAHLCQCLCIRFWELVIGCETIAQGSVLDKSIEVSA